MGRIEDAAREYQEAVELDKEAKEAAKEAAATLQKAKEKLCDAFVEEEAVSVGVDGYKYSIVPKTKFNRKGGLDDEVFFTFLRDNGLGDLIKLTVNAQSLSSAVKETAIEYARQLEELRAEDEEGYRPDPDPAPVLPEGFGEYLGQYDYYDISRTKDTSAAARAARKKKEA